MEDKTLSPQEERNKILNARTPYETLFLLTTATPEEAKYTYFKLVKKYSPEREEECFRKIRRAYEELRDPARKAAVDVMLFTGPPGRVRFKGINTSAVSQVKINKEIESLEAEFKQNPESKSGLLEAIKQRAVLLSKNRVWGEVIKDLDRIEQIEGVTEDLKENRIFVMCRAALVLAEKGQYAEAAHRWRRALRIEPERSDVLHNLAVCATLMVNKEDENRYWIETLRAWHRDLSDNGDDAYLKNLILETHKRFGGRFLNQTGDEHLRRTIQEAVAKDDGLNAPHAVGAGGVGSSSSSRPGASPQPGGGMAGPPAAPTPPITPGTPEAAGMDAYTKKNWMGAIAAFETHLKAHPQDEGVMDKLSWSYLHAKQANKAFAIWLRMIQEGPGKDLAKKSYAKAKLDTARGLKSRMMLNPALVQLKDALKVVPDSFEVYQELGNIYNERREWVNASYYYEKALEINPNDKPLRQLARTLKNRARSTKAIM